MARVLTVPYRLGDLPSFRRTLTVLLSGRLLFLFRFHACAPWPALRLTLSVFLGARTPTPWGRNLGCGGQACCRCRAAIPRCGSRPVSPWFGPEEPALGVLLAWYAHVGNHLARALGSPHRRG